MPQPRHSIELRNWTDTIYANGEKIAKVSSQDAPIHISGDNCYNCGGTASYVSLSSGAGHQIQACDTLNLTQYNAGDSVGGLILRFADGTQTSGLIAQDQNGQQINCDAVTNQLHDRHVDLSAYAGETLASTLVINDVCSPGGHFDQYFNDIAIVSSNGQVTSIYSPQLGATYSMTDATAAWPGPVSNMRAVSEPNTYAPTGATHYFVDDHLGTAQMEISAGGWPVWQGSFTPFGQEIIGGSTTNYLGQQPQDGTAMRYKFTGKERDAESGLDYFGARYYASNMGRWMSPDWADKPEAVPYSSLDNPQSLNLYGYVNNNPLSKADKDGHCPDACVVEGISAGVIVGVATVGAAAAYLATPSGQRSLSTFTSAFSSSVSSSVDTVKGWFSSSSNTPAPATTSGSHPEIVIDGNQHPESAQHAADAQAAGHPADVTIDRGRAAGNRADALRGTPAVPGAHRDEYPPAVTTQGGSGASVRPISPSDNAGAGASMGNQMRPYPNGTTVTIKPINVPNPPQ